MAPFANPCRTTTTVTGGLEPVSEIVLIGTAKEIAREWVAAHRVSIPGFRGAFFHGSTIWLPATAALPAGSDLDVMIVLAGSAPPKLGKFLYRDLLLEISYIAETQLASPAQVLGTYQLAGSFRAPSVIADPFGFLTPLQAAVAAGYARRHWVERRCAGARDNILRHLAGVDTAETFPGQVTAWLFATGVTTHVLLVAGLRNPTVRRRYLAARELLADYGRLDFYERLVDLLDPAGMSQARAMHHLDQVAAAFDAAAATTIRTPVAFASDLTPAARPLAIDGSRDLIAAGNHREAIFWLVATYSRCMLVLERDAPPSVCDTYAPGYRDLLGDLGISSLTDLRQRSAELEAFLPQVWTAAQDILAANQEIRDEFD